MEESVGREVQTHTHTHKALINVPFSGYGSTRSSSRCSRNSPPLPSSPCRSSQRVSVQDAFHTDKRGWRVGYSPTLLLSEDNGFLNSPPSHQRCRGEFVISGATFPDVRVL